MDNCYHMFIFFVFCFLFVPVQRNIHFPDRIMRERYIHGEIINNHNRIHSIQAINMPKIVISRPQMTLAS